MSKKSPAINATVAPASLIELSKKWAHDLITPEIRSSIIDSISLMTAVEDKTRKLADLLHAQGVKPYHVHLTRDEKKLGGDAVSKFDALKIELDAIFDSRLTEAQREEIKNLKTAKNAESVMRSTYRQRLRAYLIALEKVDALKDPNSEEVEEGESKANKTEHDKAIEALQLTLKRFGKVDPSTVGYNPHQICEILEKAFAHTVAHGKKPE